MDRSVLYVDIAAFPIAVERVVTPALRGRPVAVVPPGSARAPILAASLEAEGEGIRAGMPMQAALERCPALRVLPTNEPLYRRAAAAVLSLLGGYTPLLEPSIPGEAFLDLTGTKRLFGNAKDTAVRIRTEIDLRLRLSATVGVATNKLVSRVAARVIRPDGLCDIFPGSESSFLAPLPVILLPEAASAPADRFEDLGIALVRDLLVLTQPQLRIAFGWRGERLRRQALGIDDTPVCPPESTPSIAEEETLAEDSNDEAILLRVLLRLCERAGARLRPLGLTPQRLRVTLRYAGALTAARDGHLTTPTGVSLRLFDAARDLMARVRGRRERVRWIELRLSSLAHAARQLSLFSPEALAGPDTLAEAIERIRGRFGEASIIMGRILDGDSARFPGGPSAGRRGR
ncbi:MAG: DNA polymerase IV [Acidobacteriota bacterium]